MSLFNLDKPPDNHPLPARSGMGSGDGDEDENVPVPSCFPVKCSREKFDSVEVVA